MASFCNIVEVGFVAPSFKVNFFNCWEQLHASTKGHKKIFASDYEQPRCLSAEWVNQLHKHTM